MRPTLNKRMQADRSGVLSSLWIFGLFNMLFRDVHELLRPGANDEFASSTLSEAMLLGSGVALSVFVSMVVLSRVLPRQANRRANITIAKIAVGAMLTFPPNDLDDAWFLGGQIVGLLAILWLAWAWRAEAEVEADRATTKVS